MPFCPTVLIAQHIPLFVGRGEKIRTSDPLRPRQVRYQAALRPVNQPALILHWASIKSRFNRQINQLRQCLSKFFQRFTAVTDRRFSFAVNLAEGFAKGRIEKQRIVAEAINAC
jgi:hypothetical protein